MLRNPWGYGEWRLKWSENPEYISSLKQNYDKIKSYFDNYKPLEGEEAKEGYKWSEGKKE